MLSEFRVVSLYLQKHYNYQQFKTLEVQICKAFFNV